MTSLAVWRDLGRAACGIVAVTLMFGCKGAPDAAFTRLEESRRVAADLRVQFSKASYGCDRAVLADTDEASIGYSRDAEQAAQAVEGDVATLAPLLADYAKEKQILDDFGKRFADYQKLAKQILELAVENTNLKAQRLAFGPEREAADSFRDALNALASGVAGKDRCRADTLAAQATVAVREIQALQAPHIAEADDAAMKRMENDMASLDAKAREATRALAGLVRPAPSPEGALSALDRFKKVSDEIVTLSRRNSNVRSLGLTLREKPVLSAACDDGIRALQDALEQHGTRATR